MTETEIMKFLEEMSVDFPSGYARNCIALINRKNAKIERLNFENLQMIASIKGLEERARAEAIKEFAEKIYRSCAIYGPMDKFNKVVFLNIVDQIAKEMGVE